MITNLMPDIVGFGIVTVLLTDVGLSLPTSKDVTFAWRNLIQGLFDHMSKLFLGVNVPDGVKITVGVLFSIPKAVIPID